MQTYMPGDAVHHGKVLQAAAFIRCIANGFVAIVAEDDELKTPCQRKGGCTPGLGASRTVTQGCARSRGAYHLSDEDMQQKGSYVERRFDDMEATGNIVIMS